MTAVAHEEGAIHHVRLGPAQIPRLCSYLFHAAIPEMPASRFRHLLQLPKPGPASLS